MPTRSLRRPAASFSPCGSPFAAFLTVAGLGVVGLLAGCPPADVMVDDPLVGGVPELGPAEGFSVHIAPFDVPPGVETQDCYFIEVPDLNAGADIFIDRFTMGQRTGSHHMNVFRVNSIHNLSGQPGDVVRGGECRISVNWSDWPLVVNSQESSVDEPVVDWQLPAGVAQRFHPHELLMVQSHYVNADLQSSPSGGEVRINFYRSTHENPVEMGSLFATQQSIRICEHGPVEQLYTGTCSFPSGADVHIVAANGHFHSRGRTFEMFTWDGLTLDPPPEEALFYRSANWNEPEMAINLDAQVPSGGGVWWNCDYEWQEPLAGCASVNERDPLQANDCCYTFGNSAEDAEHCNAFIYYYPKLESDVFCN